MPSNTNTSVWVQLSEAIDENVPLNIIYRKIYQQYFIGSLTLNLLYQNLRATLWCIGNFDSDLIDNHVIPAELNYIYILT